MGANVMTCLAAASDEERSQDGESDERGRSSKIRTMRILQRCCEACHHVRA